MECLDVARLRHRATELRIPLAVAKRNCREKGLRTGFDPKRLFDGRQVCSKADILSGRLLERLMLIVEPPSTHQPVVCGT
jgi:hypothetical protein